MVVERLDALAAIGMRVCALQTIDAIVVVERMDTLAPIGMCVCALRATDAMEAS